MKAKQDRALKTAFRDAMQRLEYNLPQTEILGPLEIENWPKYAINYFLDWELIKAGPPASSILCMECEMLCTMPVESREMQNGVIEYFLYCGPRNYGKINLKDDNLKQWRLDLASFSKSLAELLETENEAEERFPKRLWYLGEKKIRGIRHELFLARGVAWRDFPKLIDSQKLGKSLPALFLSLTETPQNFPHPTFPLDKILIFEKAGLSFDLAAIERNLLEKESTQGNEFCFQRQGDIWFICYEGQCERIKHALGFEYLAVLLAKPHQSISALELYLAVKKTPPTALNKTKPVEPFSDQPKSKKQNTEPMIDAKAKTQYQKRLKEIEIELAKVHSKDSQKSKRISDEKAQILKQLFPKAAFRSPEEEKARQSIQANIRGALKKISKKIPKLSLHLKNSIKTGSSCTYQPQTKLDWKL
ncbi:MAG: hypothetical protein KDK66_01415 [Deltaproteobacteria bacterium]|nr:hypothetical protein [Deltaproteobacteria bacterium]